MTNATADGVAYWQARFTRHDDQPKAIATAAAVAEVDQVPVLHLLLDHPQLTVDQAALITLRVVQPPRVWMIDGVGFIALGTHTDAVAALRTWSPLGQALVALAETWTGTIAELATAAAGIAAKAGGHGTGDGVAHRRGNLVASPLHLGKIEDMVARHHSTTTPENPGAVAVPLR